MKIKITILLFAVLFITGCRYKEGPIISFRSVEKRLIGTWQITDLKSDGVDSLKYYNDSCGASISITHPYDEDYFKIYINDGSIYRGVCRLSNKKKIINVDFGIYTPLIIGPLGYGKSNWDIQKITNKELKISCNFNSRYYLISFKK